MEGRVSQRHHRLSVLFLLLQSGFSIMLCNKFVPCAITCSPLILVVLHCQLFSSLSSSFRFASLLSLSDSKKLVGKTASVAVCAITLSHARS